MCNECLSSVWVACGTARDTYGDFCLFIIEDALLSGCKESFNRYKKKMLLKKIAYTSIKTNKKWAFSQLGNSPSALGVIAEEHFLFFLVLHLCDTPSHCESSSMAPVGAVHRSAGLAFQKRLRRWGEKLCVKRTSIDDWDMVREGHGPPDPWMASFGIAAQSHESQ